MSAKHFQLSRVIHDETAREIERVYSKDRRTEFQRFVVELDRLVERFIAHRAPEQGED